MIALETGIKLIHKPAVYTEAVSSARDIALFFCRSRLFNITPVPGVKVYRCSRGGKGRGPIREPGREEAHRGLWREIEPERLAGI